MYARAVDHVEPDAVAGPDNDNRAGYPHADDDFANTGEPHTGHVDACPWHADEPDEPNAGDADDSGYANDSGYADHAHDAATGGVTTTPSPRQGAVAQIST